MIGTNNAIVVVVHGLDHLRAALAIGASRGQSVVAVSAPVATAYAGANWFLALAAAGHAEYPQVELTAILDCGDRAGDALTALDLGAKHLVFAGHADAASRLAAIAAQRGAVILDRRPAALDLLDVKDFDYAFRALPGPEKFGY